MSVFLQAGAAFGFFDVVAARVHASLLPMDGAVLFLSPVLLFAAMGAGFNLGWTLWSGGRGNRPSTASPFAPALAAGLLPVLIQGGRGCLLGCGFTPLQWGLRFLPTFLLIAALFKCRRLLARPRGSLTRLPIVLASTFSTLAFETRFDVAGRVSPLFVLGYLGWAALGIIVFLWLDARTGRAGMSALGLALVAACASALPSITARPVRPAPARAEGGAELHGDAAPSFNILLVVLDGVRADRLPPTVNRQARTPALDAFSRSSYVFTRAIASSDYSLSSHASLLTGQLPSEHGAHPFLSGDRWSRIHAPMKASVPTIAQRLRAAGFQTLGVSSNYVFLGRWTGLQKGFDRFDDSPKRVFRSSPLAPIALGLLADWFGPPFQPLQPYRPAREIQLQLQDLLSRGRSPFFAFINLMDAHEPRVPRTPRSPLSPMAARVRSYDDALEYLDAELGELLDWMNSKGLLETTCVVMTSDHGEFLGEGGLWGHGLGVAQTMLHVPLLIRPPGGLRAGATVDIPFGLHEVMPLILSWSPDGRPPEARPKEPVLLAETWTFPGGGPTEGLPDQRAFFFGDLKLVAGRSGERRLFDLRLDPSELVDRWGSLDVELRDRFETAVRRPAAARPEPQGTPDAEAIERMRSLGYLGPVPRR